MQPVGKISPAAADAAVSMIFLRFNVIPLILIILSKYLIADAVFDFSLLQHRDYPQATPRSMLSRDDTDRARR
jgi:hypothetical protein